MVCGLWFGVCGLWFGVCGLWFVVCCLWFVVYGLWFVVCGLWFVVCGLVACGSVYAAPKPGSCASSMMSQLLPAAHCPHAALP